MKKRSIFSSPAMFFSMALENPAIADVPAFAGLKPALEQYSADSKGCSCKKNGIVKQYKGLYEAALSALQDSDKQALKKALNTEEICYYITNTSNVLELKCF